MTDETPLQPHDASDERQSVLTGELIGGQYRVQGVLGRGGMGTVYVAWDEALGREVAVKVVRPALAGDPAMRASFLDEARAMARVRHRNVVTIHALGESDGCPYFVMERVEGPNLKDWKSGRVPLDPREAVEILEPLCEGVAAIHAAGALHRDLKPANVLLETGGRVAVTDFGLACPLESTIVADAGVPSGTPAYAAPEVARGEPLVAALAGRVDVYALGVIAFELLTGSSLFSATTVPQMLLSHAYDEPPRVSDRRPELYAFDAVLQRALAKSPSERTPSAAVLRDELVRALYRHGEPARPLSILLADDDAHALAALRELLLLSLPDVRVATALDAASALAVVREQHPDVVVTDLEMPHGGGLALTRELHEDAATANIPVIVVTGHGGAADWRQLKALGASRCLLKPLDIDLLVASIEALTGSPARR